MSETLRILHLADLHLGWKPHFMGPLAEERQRERDGLLRRAADFVLRERAADVVVIAGDLFETHTPRPALVESVLSDLKRLSDAGVAVVTVPGNHDEITYADSVYRVYAGRWPGVLVQNPMPAYVDTLMVNGIPVHVYGLAYTGGLTRTRPPISEFPRLERDGIHLAVFHGSLDWDSGDRSLPLTSAGLAAAGYDYVALGHIHKPSEHEVGRGLAVYPGMVEGKGFSDPGVGRFTIAVIRVRRDSEGLRAEGVELEKIPAGARPLRTVEIDVTQLSGVEALGPLIRKEAHATQKARAHASSEGLPAPRGEKPAGGPEAGTLRPIVQVRLVGAAPGFIDTEALTAKFAADFHFLEIVDDTSKLDESVIERLALEPTVRGEFVRRMRAMIRDAEDDAERELAARALRRGLAALGGSVS